MAKFENHCLGQGDIRETRRGLGGGEGEEGEERKREEREGKEEREGGGRRRRDREEVEGGGESPFSPHCGVAQPTGLRLVACE